MTKDCKCVMKIRYFWSCDIDIDECSMMNTCANGGTCTNTQGSYNCACDSGWEGQDCSTGKDRNNIRHNSV